METDQIHMALQMQRQIKMSLKSQLLLLKLCFLWGWVKTTKSGCWTRTTWTGVMILRREKNKSNNKLLAVVKTECKSHMSCTLSPCNDCDFNTLLTVNSQCFNCAWDEYFQISLHLLFYVQRPSRALTNYTTIKSNGFKQEWIVLIFLCCV